MRNVIIEKLVDKSDFVESEKKKREWSLYWEINEREIAVIQVIYSWILPEI